MAIRTWLPHLLAISTNSPFWAGRFTGLKSYRSAIWKPFPRSGIPGVFPSWSDFDNYVQTAEVIDFAQSRRLRMRDSINELLDFVDEVVDDLGSRQEMNYLRHLLEDPQGTGADRQISLYQETGSVDAVIQCLIEQTMKDIAPEIT